MIRWKFPESESRFGPATELIKMVPSEITQSRVFDSEKPNVTICGFPVLRVTRKWMNMDVEFVTQPERFGSRMIR
jgi:hypothetical protein